MNEAETVIEEVIDSEEAEALLGEDISDDGGACDTEDTQALPSDTEVSSDEAEALKEEIATLRAALEQKEAEKERILAQLGEFSELFPGVDIRAVPENVWESVRGGLPLAAAYALYEKRTESQRDLAEKVNKRNAERSSGAVGRDGSKEYYSPADVRKMSASEVRKNYNTIIESMKKWN